MKKLTRLLLIHWYTYDRELIEFENINFLTGKTAAGKSTIIDALQLVLLGDTNGNFFNKAANERSVRTRVICTEKTATTERRVSGI